LLHPGACNQALEQKDRWQWLQPDDPL
jgi:hypothetical protein